MSARGARARAKVAFWLFAAVAGFLTWRLYDIQIRQGPLLAREARSQRAQTIEIYARRGTIYDRTRTVLVRSFESESVYADPGLIAEPPAAARALAPILRRKPESIEADLRAPTRFRWLARKVSHRIAEQVRDLNVTGIETIHEETGTRFFTSGRLASTVLGFVGLDENGLDGLEYFYDDILRGAPGKTLLETDPAGRPIPFVQQQVVEPKKPGASLVLTLDAYLQYEAERIVGGVVRKFGARSGSAIVMDPHTGEILAMANVPDFDPAHYARFAPNTWRDRAITDAYEPGSTFKLITAAAGLESGKLRLDSRFPARDELEVAGQTIHNAEDGMMAAPLGSETLEQIVIYSHNVGAAEAGMRIGRRDEYRMIRRFGFGAQTLVDLPGENPGIVPYTSDWSGSSLATISFGHGVSVTPLALARAYCAIANGGLLMRPRIVAEILGADGKPIYQYSPEIEGRAISQQTARLLREVLREVVLRGTGNPTARVPGYTSAGKTGTAQVVENGGYAAGEYIASFVGYVPADAPRFVILVKIERPHGQIYGSEVAAPAFAELARIAMFHAGLLPDARLVPPGPRAKGR